MMLLSRKAQIHEPVDRGFAASERRQFTVKGRGNSRWALFMLMAMTTAEYD